jgi:hypothetical protein
MRFSFRRLQITPEAAVHRAFITSRFSRFGRFFALCLVAVAVLLVQASTVQAATARLAWDAVTGVKIYKLYYGTASRAYTRTVSVTNATEVAVSNLLGGTTYFFAVTAVGTNYLESDYSSEITHTVPVTPAGPNLGTLQIRVSPTDKQVTISGTGTPGQPLYLLVAANSSGPWGLLTNITVNASGTFQITDPTRATLASRYYRTSDSASTIGLPAGARLQIKISSNRRAILTGTVAPGKAYSMQSAPAPTGPWSTMGSVTGRADGTFSFIDLTATMPAKRFYRLVE